MLTVEPRPVCAQSVLFFLEVTLGEKLKRHESHEGTLGTGRGPNRGELDGDV
jgi:hypothetical protein